MKNLFYLAFMALFGTYGLDMLGVFDETSPTPPVQQQAEAVPTTTPALPEGHYVLKAMRHTS